MENQTTNVRRTWRQHFNKLRRPSQFSKLQLFIFISAFCVIGYFIYHSFAAAPVVASIQAEQMTPSGVKAASNGFITNLTNNSTVTSPYLWTFDPGVTATAGYFYANGTLLKKVTGPGPYVLRLNPGMLKAGSNKLGHAWDTTSGQHQAPPTSYSVKVNNVSGIGFVTTLAGASSINAPYIWAFDPGVSTATGYFWADGVLIKTLAGAGPYALMISSSTLTAGNHSFGHAWDTTSGTHQTPASSYQALFNPGSTNYSLINDTTASGGQAAKFGSGVSLSGAVSLSAQATSLTVVAHGEQCSSSWPQMKVTVDGTSVINATVSSISWTSYTANVNLAAGAHTLKIANSSGGTCLPSLYADASNFFGQTAPPPPSPTVALSASPTSVSAGQSSTLTWTSTNVTSCLAAGAWSGSEPTSGSVSTGALNQNSTYSLTCTGGGGSATASATVTVTANTTTYDQAISYTQNRPSFTPTRTVNVNTAASFNSAVANLQPGDLVKATASFTVSGETVIKNRLSATAVIDLSAYPVYFVYSGGSNLPAIWLNNAQNLRIYGGDLSTADTGGTCLLDYGSQNVLWWGFYVHDCGGSGFSALPVNGAVQNDDFEGTITKIGQHLAWDPHTEKGSGLQGALLSDSNNTNGFSNNRFAIYCHDIPAGNCVEVGNSVTSNPGSGNVLYEKAVNLTFVSTIQTGGNAVALWGAGGLGLDIKYLEVSNAQGRAVDANGSYSSTAFSGVKVEYGRATTTNLNLSLEAGALKGVRWDTRGGPVYQDISPTP